ncbi:MAG: sigma-70 family RNA polymerase sigma factor [Candidatus Omnitrophica bacterium]|nr:sigma-70 family RNA polymerase sigma factor [Candidatus Omnitrophota bacterium]
MDKEIQPTDEQLVAKAKAGDKEAFVVLFKRHKNRIYSYLSRYLADDEKAQDLTLETFMNVYNHLKDYEEEGRFLPWVYRIATNCAKKEFRKRKLADVSLDQPSAEGSDESIGDMIADEMQRPDHTAMRGEIREIIEKALLKLSEKYRHALLLCDVEGFTHEEAAGILNTNAKTVGTHVLRARKILYKFLLKLKDEF